MADGEVTFVAGQAVEQTTSGESNTPPDEREAAIAAVRKAIKEAGEGAAKEAADADDRDEFRKAVKKGNEAVEGKKEPKEPKKEAKEKPSDRDENGRFLPKEARNAGEEDEPPGVKDSKEKPKEGKERAAKEAEEHSLKKVLSERKELTELKKQRMDEAAKVQQELQQMRAMVAQERQQLEAERQRMTRLKTDPAAAIRELGYSDPEEYILELARHGTPEGQAMRQQRQQREELQQLKAWKEAQEEQARQSRQQFESQKAAKYREFVEQEFVKTALNDEAYPHAATFFKKMHPMFAVAMGDVVAEQYRQLSGREATFEQIAEYLEDTIGEWYTSKSGAQQGPGKVASALNEGQSTQGSATGRTLNPNSSSERRSLGTVIANLDGEERLAAAKDAVRIALRSSGEHN